MMSPKRIVLFLFALLSLLLVSSFHASPSRFVLADDSSSGETKFEFQAEVSRLMDIIINSLYSKKEVFLRELLSNASDALDRIRFLAVKDDKALGETPEDRELEIRVSFDKEARTLTVRDRGMGMTREELIQNLGTVAKSGTTAFVEAMAGGQGDLSMIGQFGVGFYAVYLIADKVEVWSKSNEDADQWVWSSQADSSFTIKKDPEGNTLGRGTSITMYLKEDADEFLDQARLEEIIRRYSEFIQYPIYLRKSKMEQVEDTEAEEVVEPVEGEEAAKPKKMKSVTSYSWSRINDQPAIWTRSKETVTDEEYTSFYKSASKDYSDPLTWTHFKAEGEIEFKSILYVPKVAPMSLYDNYYSKSGALKLYVRRVLIADEFEDLMPRYLSFIKGVVDSDDLPLNVSREQLQQSKVLKVIGKKLVRKALELLKQLSDDDVTERKKDDDNKSSEPTKFSILWKEFSKSLKLGVLEDQPNRLKLVKMLRYASTKQSVTTLEEYVERMPSWQSSVFFVAGVDAEEVRRSPFLERAKQKGVEVLLLSDSLDEYVMQNLPDFEGKKLQNLAKEGVKFGDETEADKTVETYYKALYAPLCSWIKTLLAESVEKVQVSTHAETGPAIVVTSQFGHSANMERMMKSQTMNDPERQKQMMAKKTLEINPRHPIVAELARRVALLAASGSEKSESEASKAKDLTWLIFEVARLNSGFDIGQPREFAERMHRLMLSGLDLNSIDLLPLPDAATLAASAVPSKATKTETVGKDLDEEEKVDEVSSDEL